MLFPGESVRHIAASTPSFDLVPWESRTLPFSASPWTVPVFEYFGVLSFSAIAVSSLQNKGDVNPLANSRKRCPQNKLASLDSGFFRGTMNILFLWHSGGPGEWGLTNMVLFDWKTLRQAGNGRHMCKVLSFIFHSSLLVLRCARKQW